MKRSYPRARGRQTGSSAGRAHGPHPGARASGERPHGPQPHAAVVLERLEDRPLGLGERAGRRFRRVRQRLAERSDQEVVRLLVEPKRARLARGADHAAGGAGEPRGVLAQPRMRGDGLRARHGQQLTATLVEHEVEAEERLEPAAEARARAAGPLRDCANPSAIRGIQVQDPIGLAVADAPQDDALGLQAAGHLPTLSEVMSRVTIYTTEPCGFCRVAKGLLKKRNVPFTEINLAKDSSGRAELVR